MGRQGKEEANREGQHDSELDSKEGGYLLGIKGDVDESPGSHEEHSGAHGEPEMLEVLPKESGEIGFLEMTLLTAEG